MAEDHKDIEPTGRRRALKLLVGAGSTVFVCALAAPAAVFVTAPANETGSGGGPRWIKTVRLETLVESEPKKVAIIADQRDAWTLTKDVELGAVWLIRHGRKVLALSATCPHLGCAINADPNRKGFNCPCHTSGFDVAGHRTGGPSPRDMDVLETRIDTGLVLVDFRKYRLSVSQRIEVG
jgi:cytochrome b6-f complex iron-sulfur subunit/menaquinol-cytochrome c reductase iron-sulfur subunit